MCWKYALTTIWICEICDNPVAPLDEPTRDLFYCYPNDDPDEQPVQIREDWHCHKYLAHVEHGNFAVGDPRTRTVQVSGEHCQFFDCQKRDADFTRFWNLRWAEQERRTQQPLDLIHEQILLDGEARNAGFQGGFNDLDFYARNRYPAMWEKDTHLAIRIVLRAHYLNVSFQTVQSFPTYSKVRQGIRNHYGRRAVVTEAWMDEV